MAGTDKIAKRTDSAGFEEARKAMMRYSIIGNSPELLNAIERAVTVARYDLSVLVTGESGTGKEVFPKIIHNYGARRHKKYIAVNCGAIPEGTIDSELFGHEKGAFTGAISARKGYFEEADGGTIFLDEVAELPLTTQARLLRVLETGEFLKVGSSTVQKTNIRVVAATNVDMVRAVREGRFREDLYYRLSTIQIEIPPLRERGNDINLLARKFAADFAEKWRLPQIEFSEEARMLLDRYRWPGNVRQLKNVVEQVALFDAGHQISRPILEKYLPENASMAAPALLSRDHSYESEREMLMSLIVNMQKRIDELENRLSSANKYDAFEDQNLMASSSPVINKSSAISPDMLSGKEMQIVPTSHYKMVDLDSAEDIDEDGFIHYSEELPAASRPEGGNFLTMRERERDAISDALRRNNGHRRAAAEELKISQRTLYRKIKEYGLE